MADIAFERLKLLFEYTKFHIGLYATLTTGLLALMSLGDTSIPAYLSRPMYITVVLFALAGAAGGVVASSICRFASIDGFRETKIGPWGSSLLRGKYWASLEHFFFWVGIVNAIAAVIWRAKYCLSGPAA